ncbi:MAG: response regulator [Pseudomonadota bacterium]|nr:response regulator [Pseudomonadota bacterium]
MNSRCALVVDDEPLLRQCLRDVLVAHSWTVTEACDGEDALRVFTPGLFDVIVLDMMMPRRDGLETLRAIREVDPNVAVLIVSGYAAPGSIQSALAMRPAAYLAKPFRASQLLSAILSLLGESVSPLAL